MIEIFKQRFFKTKSSPRQPDAVGGNNFSSVSSLLSSMRTRRQDFSRHEIRHWQAARVAFYERSNSHPLQQLYADVVLDAHLSALLSNRMAQVLHQPFVFRDAQGFVRRNLIQSTASAVVSDFVNLRAGEYFLWLFADLGRTS